MTVTEKSSRKVIVGAGWANPLTHDYVIESASWVHVFADTVELVQGVDYTVTNVLNPAGYAVTIAVPGSWAPTSWVLNAVPPIDQQKDLTVGGTFGAKYEDGLDKLSRRLQYVWDLARRGLKTSALTPVGDDGYVLPAPTSDKFLGWNSAGTQLENKDFIGITALVDDDAALTANSATRVPSQRAVKAYAIPAAIATAFGLSLLGFASNAALSSALTVLQSGVNAITRTIASKVNETLSVKDFGATGDGVTNDTVAISRAETARAAIGGELIFPPGTYLYDGQAIGRANGGAWRGVGQCTLMPSANSQVLIDVTGAVVSSLSPVPFKVSGFRFRANGKTGVTCYRESAPYYTSLQSLSFNGDFAYCAILTGSSAAAQTGWVNIDDIHQRGAGTWVAQGFDDTHYIFNVNITNLNQQGSGGATWTDLKMFKFHRAVSVYLNNVNVASLDGGADGVSMDGDCQGVFLVNTIIGWPRTGVKSVVGTDTLIPSYVYLVNCGFDQPTVAGLDIAGRTWRIHNTNSTNGYLRGSTDASLHLRATATDIVVRDFLAAYMNHDGIKVDVGATKIILAGVTAENNNQNAGGNFEINLTSCLKKDVILEGRNYIGAAGVSATGQRVVNGKSSDCVSMNNTPVATTAVITAEDVMTYSIPAGSLKVGQRVRCRIWGTTAANANAKTARLWFGTTNLGGWSTTLNALGWEVSGIIVITAAATQSYARKTDGPSTITQATSGTGADAISGAIIVKCQLQNGVASAGDITCNGMEVEVLD